MSSNIFTIMPVSQRFSLEPGETYTGKISVINPNDAESDFHFKVSVSPYGVLGQDYTADLATMTSRTQIKDWITIKEPKGVVKPNEAHEVEFTIKVPKDAPGGGQYAALLFSSDTDAVGQEGVAINNVFEVASLVYATVAGETKHDGEVLENNVPGFVVSAPITATALISNNGNVHEDATFVITVKNFFTGDVILEPNDSGEGTYTELIMPETTKEVTRDISNLPALGIVKVNQTIYYRGQSSVVEKDVIICPIWFMALCFATLIAIIAAIVAIVRKNRRKKRKEAV